MDVTASSSFARRLLVRRAIGVSEVNLFAHAGKKRGSELACPLLPPGGRTVPDEGESITRRGRCALPGAKSASSFGSRFLTGEKPRFRGELVDAEAFGGARFARLLDDDGWPSARATCSGES